MRVAACHIQPWDLGSGACTLSSTSTTPPLGLHAPPTGYPVSWQRQEICLGTEPATPPSRGQMGPSDSLQGRRVGRPRRSRGRPKAPLLEARVGLGRVEHRLFQEHHHKSREPTQIFFHNLLRTLTGFLCSHGFLRTTTLLSRHTLPRILLVAYAKLTCMNSIEGAVITSKTLRRRLGPNQAVAVG